MGRHLPSFLTPVELDTLLVQGRSGIDTAPSPGRKLAARRDFVMIQTGRLAGLRVSELCSLRIEDLDLSRRFLPVKRGKGDKDRNLPIALKLVRCCKSGLENGELVSCFQGLEGGA